VRALAVEYCEQLEKSGRYVPHHLALPRPPRRGQPCAGAVPHGSRPLPRRRAPGGDRVRDQGTRAHHRELLGPLAGGALPGRARGRPLQHRPLRPAHGARSGLRVRPGQVALRALDAPGRDGGVPAPRSAACWPGSTSWKTR
jgi:hypothetical protein